ncbi:MAG: Uma2 family endonuclease [Arcicella sp.]|nr:Uma2 family endonuclease [Arcicella sp.]
MIEEKIEISKRKSRKIPSNLIREELRGKPLYYRGYKDVLNGTKKMEEIMGCSSLQSLIISIIDFFVKSNINRKFYWVASNEAGIHLGHKNNLSTDLGIFLKEKVTPNDKYFDVAPEIAVEVDVRIETERDLDYIFEKSEEMIKFGTKKILWIITRQKKIFVISANETIQVLDYHQDIALMENITLNLGRLLDEEGLVY